MRRGSRIVGILAIAVVGGSLASSAGSAPLNAIYGTGGNDTIAATPAADVIYAKSGNDVITGVGSDDVVYASSGNDKVLVDPLTPASNVVIDTNVGHDVIKSEGILVLSTINSGSGNDVIEASGCAITLAAESGNDKYTNNAVCAPGVSSTSMGNGHDEVVQVSSGLVHLGNGNDKLTTSYVGSVVGSSGNERITINTGWGANVQLGAGHDVLELAHARGATVVASNGNDRVLIRGGDGHVVHGQSGNDTTEISELGAGNALFGGSGRDKARLADDSSGTTCNSIENVVDWSHHHRICS